MDLSQSKLSTTSPAPPANLKQVRLADNIAEPFDEVHWAIKDRDYSEFWLKGGRGSTKSSFAALEIILGIMKDPDANGFVCRKVGDTIRNSVLETLLWAIEKLEVGHLFDHTRSPAEITYLSTGQKIIMKGLDDPLKIKSIKIKRGYFKFLWFEEGAEFSPVEIRSVKQSVLRGGDVYVEFFSYNPPNDPAAWVNKEAARDPAETPQRLVHHSNYLEVPPEWLGKKFLADAAQLKKDDHTAWLHEYMGEAVGRAEQIIFHGKWEMKEFDTPAGVRFHHGADWGFANDPTVLLRMFIEDECLYIDREVFGYRVEIDETPQLFDKIPTARKWPIKADNARPETISYMRRKGFNISPAEKWPGCVEDRIAHLKGFRKIYVHPTCVHTAREFAVYSYKVDRVTQEVLPIIVDKDNHGIDSAGYGLDGYIQRRGVAGVWAKL